jgi:UrcA family protein
MKNLYAAAVMLGMLAGPAFASGESVPFPDREAVAITVSTHDLDLNSPRDQKRLQRRMARAAAAACNNDDVYAVYSGPDAQCHREIAQSVASKMQGFAQYALLPTAESATGKN